VGPVAGLGGEVAGKLTADSGLTILGRWYSRTIILFQRVPGCDGEASFDDLRAGISERLAAGRYRFDFAPLLSTFREFAGSPGPTRAPRIILAAYERASGDRAVVLRGCKPAVPREWLASAFVCSG
jgi:hypothetical protein